jgi:DNA polymerase-1
VTLGDVKLHLVNSLEDVITLHSWLGERRPVNALGLDTETTGLNKQRDTLRLVQVGDGARGFAFSWDRWSGIMESLVRSWQGDWILHNSTFDMAFLDRAGVCLPRHRVHDTMVLSRINEPHMSMALKNQATRHVDAAAAGLQTELAGTKWTWATVPLDYQPYWAYAALDPVLTYRLFEHHYPITQREAPKAYDLERAVLWVTERMERYGVHVDRALATQKLREFEDYCERVEEWCRREYGVKPGSSTAIIEILEDAGFTFSKATKSGAKSLDADVLDGIDHPLARAVLQRRQVQKMASTYLRFYVEEADADDLLHPSINTLGARTSRMSMDSPNVQNLPRFGTSRPGDVVRNMITTRHAGGSLVMCDFDQIEARLLAHVADEHTMIKAFTDGGDFFVNLARLIYDDDTITKSDPRRQVTKNATYATLYGAGVPKFAQTAGISLENARAFRGVWNQRFPGVQRFQSDVINTALSAARGSGVRGVRSPFTQRWLIADEGKEYALVNFIIQCGAGEIFKMKLVELASAGLDEWMFAPVHDEVLLDVPGEHVADVAHTLRKIMNDDQLLNVPITASVSRGESWGAKLPYVFDESTSHISTTETLV